MPHIRTTRPNYDGTNMADFSIGDKEDLKVK